MADSKGLLQRIERAGSAIDPALSDDDVERIVDGAGQKLRRRSTAVRAGAGLVAVVIGVVVVVLARGGGAPPTPSQQARRLAPAAPAGTAAAAPAVRRFADGSTATALDEAAAIDVPADSPRAVVVELRR